jgi:precorrin-6A/cobalt-precorrin-6A reductase
MITARGPFTEADERALLETHRIEIIVAKNSGGTVSYPKLAAARALALPVILVDRPPTPDAAATVEELLARLE